jgi:hypothetical protein
VRHWAGPIAARGATKAMLAGPLRELMSQMSVENEVFFFHFPKAVLYNFELNLN